MQFREILRKILNVIISFFPFIPYLKKICQYVENKNYTGTVKDEYVAQCNNCGQLKVTAGGWDYCPGCGCKIEWWV